MTAIDWQGRRRHGTVSSYSGGCRCEDCRSAKAADLRERSLHDARIAWGAAPPRLVDATPARQHIQALRASGMGVRTIAAEAGVVPAVIQRLVGWNRDRPALKLRPDTEAKLFSVRPGTLAPSTLVSAGPTGRKVRALIAAGYPRLQMATAIGVQASNFRYADLEEWHLVKVRRAAQIDALYQQLSGMPGTSVRARNEGRRRGWPPPLAWDDIDAGVLADDEDVDASSCSTCDEIGHLAGVTPWPEIAARLGMGLHGMEAHLRRHGTHGRLLPEVYAEVAQLRRAPS